MAAHHVAISLRGWSFVLAKLTTCEANHEKAGGTLGLIGGIVDELAALFNRCPSEIQLSPGASPQS